MVGILRQRRISSAYWWSCSPTPLTAFSSSHYVFPFKAFACLSSYLQRKDSNASSIFKSLGRFACLLCTYHKPNCNSKKKKSNMTGLLKTVQAMLSLIVKPYILLKIFLSKLSSNASDNQATKICAHSIILSPLSLLQKDTARQCISREMSTQEKVPTCGSYTKFIFYCCLSF